MTTVSGNYLKKLDENKQCPPSQKSTQHQNILKKYHSFSEISKKH